MKAIAILLLCVNLTLAQQERKADVVKEATSSQTYEIPFASKDNSIKLAVENSSTIAEEGMSVAVTNAPAWLKFASKNVLLAKLNAKEEQTASFSFNVEKNAEVNKDQTLIFAITDKTGQMWKKEIKFRVAPPANYEVFQNYPNPFNPTTVLSYQLSASRHVNLKVYDILGREVAELVKEKQDAGYHQTTFDAGRFASGVYLYRIIAADEQNNNHVFQKKMILLR
jgi:hypothetical protein